MRMLQVTLWTLLSLAQAAPSAAPPDKARDLGVLERIEVARLTAEFERSISADNFEAAVKTAQQITEYRAQRQGESHWEVIDARLLVKTWQRPAKDCAELKRALKFAIECQQLQQRLRYREAEAKEREALAIRQKVLGELHPHTATSYNNVAFCLDNQSKHVEALPLYRKALAIREKVLGEKHPETADSYSNVAACLNYQDRHAEALPLFRKALAIHEKVLGEHHPNTADSYNNLAFCLDSQGKHGEALPLFRKALAIHEKVLGEQHPDTARGYNNVAACLDNQGKHAEALPLYRKALVIREKLLGEQHPLTTQSYSNVAFCLNHQGKYAEAFPLYRKVLAIREKVLGEHHPDTANSYSDVADCLYLQAKYAEALPLYRKALAIHEKVLGEQHLQTGISYNNLAACLDSQGKHAEALPLFRKSLAIREKILGEQHTSTATGYNNVAACLCAQRKHAEALSLFRKALAIHEKILREQHPLTATSYSNLASCLDAQDKPAEALPLYRKALAIREKVLGEQHADTAASCNNLAHCLKNQGKHAEALPLYRKALAIFEKVLGKQHPDTATSYNNLAFCLGAQGKHAEAVAYWEKALLGNESSRLHASDSTFDRSLFQARSLSPRLSLAVTFQRLDRPLEAWEHAESDLARGLLDALLPSADSDEDAEIRIRIERLNQVLLPLLTREMLDAEQVTHRDSLTRDRDQLHARLAEAAARRSRERVSPLESIRKQIPADAAIVFWVDELERRLGCVLRHEGLPRWVALPGSGKEGWIKEDDTLPARTLAALADAGGKTEDRQKLLSQLQQQRLAPLEPHLKGVRHLVVIPAGLMAKVPVEALTDRWTVSYAASASVFARHMAQHRPVEASSLLVLADPTFTRTTPKLPPAPPHGLLLKAVTPGSIAARIGLCAGDVLLEYGERKLTTADDLKETTGEDRVALKLWREGKTLSGRIPAGSLGVVVDKRPIAEALVDWRKQETALLNIGRGEEWASLPGTRLEARTLTALVPKTDTLLDSGASEEAMDELVRTGKLKQYRLLHLATHGQASGDQPRETALILSQDKLPTAAEAAAMVLAGKKPPEGKLTVGRMLEKDWQLDADLVVLSACESGLGAHIQGEGMLGFTQALLQKGARSVVLSRWKVDDAATALLMERFYRNLLGKRDGLKEAMKRAEALAEAKSWLRNLSRAEAEKRLAALVDGVPRGERGSIKAALPTRKPDAPMDDRPFAHPYYWAAFVLIGDPF